MKKFFLLLLLITSEMAWAQNGMTTKVTVFKSDNSSPKPVTKGDSIAALEHNCIKWNYFLLGRGVFLMNYEFLIKKNLTGEVGLGLTYRDFVFEFFKGINNNGNGNSGSYWENDGTPGVNLAAEGGLRYYISGFDNFEGFYVGAALSYRQYSFPNSPNINQYGTLVPGYNFLDGQFKIGFQYESRYSDFTYDTYIGIGFRNATLSYYQSEQVYNNVTGGYVPTYVPQTVNESFPQFLFGTKIGYSF
jgi:hypothetical protein